MGDWNPSAPQLYGLEWAPDVATTTAVTTAQGAIAIVRSTQAELIEALLLRPRSPAEWSGSSSAQLVADICISGNEVPTDRQTTSYLPNQETGRAGWVGEAPGLATTNLFGHVNERYGEVDFTDSIFHNGSGPPHSATIKFGINSSGFPSGRRVVGVLLRSWVRGGSVEFSWVFGGVAYGKYVTGYNGVKGGDGFTGREHRYGELCPWTGLPWTQADIVNLSNGTAYLRVDRADRATGFYTPTVASIEIVVIHYAENRIATAVGSAGGSGGEPSDVVLSFPSLTPWSKQADTWYSATVRPAKGTDYAGSVYWRRLYSSKPTGRDEPWTPLPPWLGGSAVAPLDPVDGTPTAFTKFDPDSAHTLMLRRYSETFVQAANGMATNAEVLHQYDLPALTAGATTTPDRRTGQTARTGSMTGGYWGLDSALPPSNLGVRLGEGGGVLTVASYDPPDTAVFTYAFVVRFNKFEVDHVLVSGAGTGYEVRAIDAGTGYQIRVQKTGGGTVATSTVTITDVWKDHLVIVSMNGGTASTRIVIDGVLCTGSITAQTNGAHTSRTLGASTAIGNYIVVSAYAEWSRQLSTLDEARLLRACQWDYRPQPMLQGVHSPLQFYAASLQDQISDAVSDNLTPDFLRMDCRWANIQTTNGGAYDWSLLDHAVNTAVGKGQQILMTVLGSPTWATGGTSEYSIPMVGAAFTTWLNNYVTFVTAAVNRYKDRVKRWELGNEMNYGAPGVGFWQSLAPSSTSTTSFTAGTSTTLTLANASAFPTSGSGAIQAAPQIRTDFSWTGKTGNQLTGVTSSGGYIHGVGATVQQLSATQWTTDYSTWANALRAAMLAADPSAHICTGGIQGWGYIGVGLSGQTFIVFCFVVGTTLAQFDAYGIHPYPGGTRDPRVQPDFDNGFSGAIRKLRDHCVIAGRGAAEIWATEFGWYYSTDQDTAPHLATTQTYIANAFNDLRDYHSKYVRLASYFVDFDRPTSGFYGLLTGVTAAGSGTITGPELAPKVTADTFRTLATTRYSIHTVEGAYSSDSQPYAETQSAELDLGTVTQERFVAPEDRAFGAVRMLVRPPPMPTTNALTVEVLDLTGGTENAVSPPLLINRDEVLTDGQPVGDWYGFQKQLLFDAALIDGRAYAVRFSAPQPGWQVFGVRANKVLDANGNVIYPDAPATFGGTIAYATMDDAVQLSGADIPLALGVRPAAVSGFAATVERRSLGTFRAACVNFTTPGPLEAIEYARLTWDETDVCVLVAHDLDHRTAAEDALFPPGSEYGLAATGINYAWVAPDGPVLGYSTEANGAIWSSQACAFSGGGAGCTLIASSPAGLPVGASYSHGVWRAPGHIIGYSLFEDTEVWSAVSCLFTNGPAFGYYEIQRWDHITDEWQQIAVLSDPSVHQFDDHEMRRNVPSFYRIRQVRADGIASPWSGGRSGPLAQPSLAGPALVFTSNEDSQLAVAYTDVYSGADAQRDFGLLDSGEVVFRKLYGTDKQLALSPTESLGVQFQRTLLLQALDAPAVPGLPVFERLRAIARAPVPHVCVSDHEGNRWFAALQVSGASIREPLHVYQAAVTVTEVIGPVPVSRPDAAIGYPWFGLSGRWGIEPVGVKSVLYGGDAERQSLQIIDGGDGYNSGVRVWGGDADGEPKVVTIDGVAMLVAAESLLNLAVADLPSPDGSFSVQVAHYNDSDDGAGIALRVTDAANFLYVIVNHSTDAVEAGMVLAGSRIVLGTFPGGPSGVPIGATLSGSSLQGGTTMQVLVDGSEIGAFQIADPVYDGATLAGLAMLNGTVLSPSARWDNFRWSATIAGELRSVIYDYN